MEREVGGGPTDFAAGGRNYFPHYGFKGYG